VSVADRIGRVAIKLAPGLPHSAIPAGWSFETIALGADLKEGVLWSPAFDIPDFTATVVDGATVHTLSAIPGDRVGTRAPEPGDILYDPNPAIGRAGLVEDLARSLGAKRIDAQIAFLVGREPVPTPFARAGRVLASLPWHERNLKQAVIDLNGGEVTIRRRGLPGNVDEITKRLRGRGNRPLWIAMTRVDDRPWAIVADPSEPRVDGRLQGVRQP
jgi:hypothetical protein